jgi:hydroxylamine reductase (hybrid-cluster protein)
LIEEISNEKESRLRLIQQKTITRQSLLIRIIAYNGKDAKLWHPSKLKIMAIGNHKKWKHALAEAL